MDPSRYREPTVEIRRFALLEVSENER